MEFSQWTCTKTWHILGFDGASKGNPEVASARGVLYNPRGNVEFTFTWNIGQATNSQAEAYALYQSLSLANA